MTDEFEDHGARLNDWVGRTIESGGQVTREAVVALEATLHSRVMTPHEGSAAPLLAHWLAFLEYPPLD